MTPAGFFLLLILTFVCIGLAMLLHHNWSELRRVRKRFGPVVDFEAEGRRLQRKNAALRRAHEAEEGRAAQERQRLATEAARQRARWEEEFSTTTAELATLSRQLERARSEADVQSVGLYEPLYDFATSEEYKAKLDSVRAAQKELVRAKRAAVCPTEWQVDGSAAKGRTMIDRQLRLQLRAFNGEGDAAISKVKFNNIHAIEARIQKAFEAINKLAESNACSITTEYLRLKLDELRLVHEHAERKQAEKEEQQRIREQMREEEKARRELEKAQREAEAAERRQVEALELARRELLEANEAERGVLESKVAELERQLQEAHENSERAISRAQQTKSGHVYIISNEGSFGRDVYKLGMTRRLDPMDRVKELGDASVPFVFDVHAMVYSDDAPGLEATLHQAFDARRVNLVNNRKEFFQVRLEEVEAVVRSHHGSVEFIRTAIAEEYRKTLALRAKRAEPGRVDSPTLEDPAVTAARTKLEALRTGWRAEPIPHPAG